MDGRSTDSITSWFLRLRVSAGADPKAEEQGGKRGKQQQRQKEKEQRQKEKEKEQREKEKEKEQREKEKEKEQREKEKEKEQREKEKEQRQKEQREKGQQEKGQREKEKEQREKEQKQKEKEVAHALGAPGRKDGNGNNGVKAAAGQHQVEAAKHQRQEDKQRQQEGHQQPKQQHLQKQAASPAGSGGEDKKRHPPIGLVAAAAAVADRAKEAVKSAAAAADAEEERQKKQQQQQQQQQHRPAEVAATGHDASGSGSASGSSKERDQRDKAGEQAAPTSGRDQQQQQQPAPLPGTGAGGASGSQRQQQQQQAEQQQVLAQHRQIEEAEEDEEAEDRPRVVAYSDSDSDVESHIQRVKHHFLPSKEEEEAAAAAAAAAELAAAAEAAAAAALEAAWQRAPLRRLARASGGAAGAVAHAAGQHLTPGLAVRAGGLLALTRLAPTAATAISALSMAAPLLGAAAGRTGIDVAAALPPALLTVGQELGQLGKAAAAIAAGRLINAGLRHQRRQQQRRRSERAALAATVAAADSAGPQEAIPLAEPSATSSNRLLRHKSSVNLAALGACDELGAAIEQRQPQTAAEWAAVYSAELAELRRMLQENKVELPADRFDATQAELMRFCKATGLLAAKTPEQRAAAVEAGFSRVVHTAEWLSRQRFLSDRELRRWDRLVAWKAHDSSGRPILLARLGRAQQLVKPERYEEFAMALLTLVHRGLVSQLSNTAGAAEKMVVVLDCRGGSSVGLTRHMGLLKRLTITMNQHYPDRLFRLHLLELPLLLRWALHAITPLLHPNTRSKVVMSSINDPDLPVTVAYLTKRRSSMGRPSLRRTASNCSFLSSGDSTPALLSPSVSNQGMTPALAAAAVMAAGAAAAAAAPSPPPQPSRFWDGQPSATVGAPQGEARTAAATRDVAASSGACRAGQPVQRQEQQQQQQVAEEDVPHTPPPTLKAPQSPKEVARARRQLQQKRQEEQPEQEQEQQGEREPQGLQGAASQQAVSCQADSSRPSSPFVSSAQHSLELQDTSSAGQQTDEGGPRAAAAALPNPLVPPACAAQPGAAAAAATADAAAAEQPCAVAASAVAVPSSHAVPWSPGMQSPAGDLLSRDSSYGEEVVPAARAKAAADAVRDVDWEAQQPPQELLAGVPSAAALRAAASPPLPAPLLRTQSSAASSISPQHLPLPPPSPASGSRSSGALAGLAALLAALVPAGRRRYDGGSDSLQDAASASSAHQHRPLLHRVSAGSSGSAGSGGSSPRTPTGSRRRGGLTDLPERPAGRCRSTPGRGLTPRKSSLRRTASAEAAGTSSRKLGSHPLRRQSSVSWAEELEMVKEIAPQEASPTQPWRQGSPLRARLAAARQQHVLLTAFVLFFMMALLAHRLGLSILVR